MAADSRVTVGHARFTVITPNLIRIEYARTAGGFTDEPTLFAANREARFASAHVTQKEAQVSIDTGELRLDYHEDGKPLDAGNLSVLVKCDGKWNRWTPGMADPENLGGTLRTLDGARGPEDLGMGLISRSGWAMVDDSGTPVLTKGWVKSRDNKAETDWYFFGYGHDYHAALRSLAAISGPVPLPRKNLLGVWYSRYWPYTSEEFKEIVRQYEEHGFPLDNIVMDMDWHVTHFPGVQKEAWTGYTWNKKLIPDPPALLKWFHDQGLFVTLNDHPADGVQPDEKAYTAFMRAMGENPDSGKTLPFDAGSKKYLDAFYATTHASLEKEGVDFWWLDWQQFPDTISVPDLRNLPWLNRYNFLRSETDGKRGVSFSRWGGWGDQKYPIHFSGDADTGWPMLAFEVPFTSTSGNVGCFFWTHDIGGHMGGRNEESYARWCQFGAMSASLRSHSTRKPDMDRRPWTYPKWAEDSMRISFRLRAEMFPYIYSSAAESCRESEPLLRPMYFAHPEEEETYHNAQQYYLGDNLLVAPIAMPGVGPSRIAWQRVWFPPKDGAWFNYFTSEKYEPGTQAVVACDINSFPLFVRGGTPLVMQPYTPRPATAPLDHLIIRCYPGEDNAGGQTTLYEDDGQTQAYLHGESARTNILYSRKGDTYTVMIFSPTGGYTGMPAKRSYTIELPDIAKPAKINWYQTPGTVNYDDDTSIAKIGIPQQGLEKMVRIDVQASLIDPRLIHERAVAARLRGVTGTNIATANLRHMVDEALAAASPDLGGAVLAAAGAEIYSENDAPYLFGGQDVYRLHIDPGILDSDQTEVSLRAEGSGKSSPGAAVRVHDGMALDLAQVEKTFPRDITNGDKERTATLDVSVKAAGRDCVMELPINLNGQ